VIYYYYDETVPLYALLVYPKNAKTDLTQEDKKAASAFVDAINATRKSK
jgi:hypothetical protein